MSKIKLIIYEKFDGKQSLEDVLLSAFKVESGVVIIMIVRQVNS